jgi:hypothetical protein
VSARQRRLNGFNRRVQTPVCHAVGSHPPKSNSS